jgi:hypothetical protein
LVSDKRSPDQTFSGFTQSWQIDLQKGGDSVVMIKTQSVSIRNSNQKKIEKDFQSGKISQETRSNKAVIDPAEGAFDLSNSVGEKDSFDSHRLHILASMVPFSFGQPFLSNEFWISRQGKVKKETLFQRVERQKHFVYQDGMNPIID